MKIERLQTNHIKNPIGFALGRPVLSWVVTESSGKGQKAARVRLASDLQMEHILFDSGPNGESRSMAHRLPGAAQNISPKPSGMFPYHMARGES